MNNKKSWIILIIVLVIIAAAGVIFLKDTDVLSFGEPAQEAVSAGAGDYQAVFLANGQVYFGKLSGEKSEFMVLRDIYYLQFPQSIQQGQPATGEPKLIKLGGELHGPADEMRINRDQVMFIEDLRSDSKVVKAIKEYVAGQQAGEPTGE